MAKPSRMQRVRPLKRTARWTRKRFRAGKVELRERRGGKQVKSRRIGTGDFDKVIIPRTVGRVANPAEPFGRVGNPPHGYRGQPVRRLSCGLEPVGRPRAQARITERLYNAVCNFSS